MVFTIIGFIAILAAIDLTVKYLVEESVGEEEEFAVFKGRILIRKVHNKGLAFNRLEKNPKAVRGLSGFAFLAALCYSAAVFRKDGQHIKKAGLVLTLAGAVSNVYDRLVRKYVVDYFGFCSRWKRVQKITFNLGDMFIFIGSILLVITEIFKKRGQ